MNQTCVVLTTLLHYNVCVRDTLEYTLRKDAYDVNLFKEKKRSILVEVDQPTPLKNIIDHSGENGEKLEKNIREFYEEVYGDNSTILSLATDGLRVDHNQHMAIYRHVLPIHENITAMITGIVNDSKTKNVDISEVQKAIDCEEAMYRSVAFLTLTGDLVRLFGEYNQARAEAKGEETPASRFIGNDLGEVIKNINFVRGNAKLRDVVYKNMEDKIVRLMEYMTGRRDLPAGKNFNDVNNETIETIRLYIRDAEPAFQSAYPPIIKALIEQVQNDEKNKKTEGEGPKA